MVQLGLQQKVLEQKSESLMDRQECAMLFLQWGSLNKIWLTQLKGLSNTFEQI